MNVRPRRWLHDNAIRELPPPRNHVVVECEVTSPPSAVGRTVYLWLDVEDTTDMLLALRAAAIRHRSQPECD